MAVSLSRMTPQQSRAWLALISTAELLPAALDAQLQRDASLTHYEFILLSALQRGGAQRLSDLAAATNATLPRTSKVVSRLQQRGLLARQESEQDRRSVLLELTKQGRRQLVLATPEHFETVHRLVLDRLSPEQLDQLADALEPVVQALDPQRRFGPF
ncbi:MarR family transcriptional regulator [Microbacterium aerolatum]|uniref:MarR family transcriptional regulator n=1 Tax=Microbacterium aerolatum TaxID=153731 RepID=A0A511ACB0_9MICO|nr:MarR family transcriptional regulator [Microbacterium aerolatum]MCK3769584.1 MarR family transcriptional regulator [Microbacterium aerolatum]GEK85804.1 MarR family transcriptional regulator [Microbacterium aerolatum]GGB20223.1 MarR family transcriptional regulator [Microbacterium aerolatum]